MTTVTSRHYPAGPTRLHVPRTWFGPSSDMSLCCRLDGVFTSAEWETPGDKPLCRDCLRILKIKASMIQDLMADFKADST